jgi:hypothetical protein
VPHDERGGVDITRTNKMGLVVAKQEEENTRGMQKRNIEKKSHYHNAVPTTWQSLSHMVCMQDRSCPSMLRYWVLYYEYGYGYG